MFTPATLPAGSTRIRTVTRTVPRMVLDEPREISGRTCWSISPGAMGAEGKLSRGLRVATGGLMRTSLAVFNAGRPSCCGLRDSGAGDLLIGGGTDATLGG